MHKGRWRRASCIEWVHSGPVCKKAAAWYCTIAARRTREAAVLDQALLARCAATARLRHSGYVCSPLRRVELGPTAPNRAFQAAAHLSVRLSWPQPPTPPPAASAVALSRPPPASAPASSSPAAAGARSAGSFCGQQRGACSAHAAAACKAILDHTATWCLQTACAWEEPVVGWGVGGGTGRGWWRQSAAPPSPLLAVLPDVLAQQQTRSAFAVHRSNVCSSQVRHLQPCEAMHRSAPARRPLPTHRSNSSRAYAASGPRSSPSLDRATRSTLR